MEEKILELVQSIKSSSWDTFFSFMTHFGEAVIFVLFFALMYWVFSKDYALRFALFYLVSVGVNGLLKVCVNRTRPNGNSGSFPSGHSQSIAFVGTATCDGVFKSNSKLWFKIYILIDFVIIWAIVALSRIYLNFHWFTDVLGGLVIAIALYYLLLFIWSVIPQNIKTLKNKYILMYCLIGVATVCYIILSIVNPNFSSNLYLGTGITIGLCVGNILDDKLVHYVPDTKFKSYILKLIVGLLIIGVYYYLFMIRLNKIVYLIPVLYMVLMLLITFVIPLIFKKWADEEKRIASTKSVEGEK